MSEERTPSEVLAGLVAVANEYPFDGQINELAQYLRTHPELANWVHIGDALAWGILSWASGTAKAGPRHGHPCTHGVPITHGEPRLRGSRSD